MTGVITSNVGINGLVWIDDTFVKSAATTELVTGLIDGVSSIVKPPFVGGVATPLVSNVHFRASNILRGQKLVGI